MEEQLLDYLYGELEPEHRAAFERALPAHPEVAAELERHRWTRARMAELPVVPLPAGALDQAMLAAERHIASVAPAKPAEGFFARLAKLFMQPAFATALVAMLAVGVGLFMSKSRELPGEGPRADDQAGQLGLAPPRAAEAPVPAVRVTEHTKAAAAPTPPPSMDAPNEAAPEVATISEKEAKLEEAFAAPPTVDPSAAPPAAEPAVAMGNASKPADRGGDAAQAKPARARTTTQTQGPAASGGAPADEYVLRSADSAVAKDIAAEAKKGDSAAEPAPDELGSGLVSRPDEAPGVWGDAAPPVGSKTTNTEDQAAATTARDGATGLADKVAEDSERRAPSPTGANTVREIATEQTLDRESRTVSIDDDAKPAPPAPKLAAEKAPAPAKPTTTPDRKADPKPATEPAEPGRSDKSPAQAPPAPLTEARLWTIYQQQLAAGAYADADKTLADLRKLTGETAKLKAARTELGKRSEEAKRADKPAVDPKLPDPSAPAPGKAP